ncbi:MAG TPA: HK97 family phage prohead protease [Acidimicrobiales bacterium]|nr:HK97 family phage prohead protease [Acidimicrobiales bacterium]
MLQLTMEIRSVNVDARTVVGCCVPYDETSYLTPDPVGERVLRGAFAKSIKERAGRIFLYRNHDHDHAVGHAVGFDDRPDGLIGTFGIRAHPLGDDVLAELREGYLPAMSVGFRTIKARRADDGVNEIVEGALMEVSLLSLPAYAGAEVLEVRRADIDEIMAGFGPRPDLDLSPIPTVW